jgi:uncharacterized integral membrane protein
MLSVLIAFMFGVLLSMSENEETKDYTEEELKEMDRRKKNRIQIVILSMLLILLAMNMSSVKEQSGGGSLKNGCTLRTIREYPRITFVCMIILFLVILIFEANHNTSSSMLKLISESFLYSIGILLLTVFLLIAIVEAVIFCKKLSDKHDLDVEKAHAVAKVNGKMVNPVSQK